MCLQAEVSADSPALPQLQELLPALLQVLRRGRDNAATYAALEACALLGGPQALASSLEPLLGSLQRSIAGLQAAPLTKEAVKEADAACALAAVLLHALGEGAAPLLRAAAAAAAAPQLERAAGVAEGLFEVLARVLLAQPGALASLLPADAQPRFLDAWLAVAQTRYLEEVLGVPSMAAMGRLRRRMAAAALMLLARASPALADDPQRLGRAFALAARACLEAGAFQEDGEDLQRSLAEGQQGLVARRLALSASHPVWGIDLRAALREAFHAAAAAHGEAKLVEAAGWGEGALEGELRRLVQG